MEINICKDYTETPGARYRAESAYSGEDFRESVLIPKYLEAKETGEAITVNLDGGYGYPPSFLEEAFGGLARLYNSDDVLSVFNFISEDEPSLIEEIEEYIRDAKKD